MCKKNIFSPKFPIFLEKTKTKLETFFLPPIENFWKFYIHYLKTNKQTTPPPPRIYIFINALLNIFIMLIQSEFMFIYNLFVIIARINYMNTSFFHTSFFKILLKNFQMIRNVLQEKLVSSCEVLILSWFFVILLQLRIFPFFHDYSRLKLFSF